MYARLAERGIVAGSDEGRWVRSHAAAACKEHATCDFDRRIDTDGRTPDEVADDAITSLAATRESSQ